MGDFAILNALGVRVRIVEDLGDVAIWMPDYDMLLIDRSVPSEVQTAIADVTLSRVSPVPHRQHWERS